MPDAPLTQASLLVRLRDARDEQAWEKEYDQRLFTWAAAQVRAQVREATWQAFWQTAIEGKRGKEVVAALGLSLAAVRLAKSRVLARLKPLIQQAQDSTLQTPLASAPQNKANL
jgi:hypothetical protein